MATSGGGFLIPPVYGVAGKADHVVAGSPVKHTVAAWTGLVDLEYPLDFVKFRLGCSYVSGDRNPNDTKDTGFDSISDAVQLFGGPISYFVGENIKFGAGDFVRANSFYPSLRGANGQANYVNPGLQLMNTGMDVTFSPRVQLADQSGHIKVGPLTRSIREDQFELVDPFGTFPSAPVSPVAPAGAAERETNTSIRHEWQSSAQAPG